MLTTERLERANQIILSIKKDNRVVGSVAFFIEEQGEIVAWENAIQSLNEKKK